MVATALRLLRRDPEMFLRRCAQKLLPMPRRHVRMHIRDISFDCNLPEEFEALKMAESMRFRTFASDIVAVMKRFLCHGDVFIDVGANVGYVSAWGMAVVGRTGEVHSFEPVPKYYKHLLKLAVENPQFKIMCNNLAASDLTGLADIAASRHNPGWNTIVPGFMPQAEIMQVVKISTIRLDSYIERHVHPRKVKLIKIDTEGFELPVLRGLSKYFDSGERPIIICEVAPGAYAFLGYNVSDLMSYMTHYGYAPHGIRPRGGKFLMADLSNLQLTSDFVWLPRD